MTITDPRVFAAAVADGAQGGDPADARRVLPLRGQLARPAALCHALQDGRAAQHSRTALLPRGKARYDEP